VTGFREALLLLAYLNNPSFEQLDSASQLIHVRGFGWPREVNVLIPYDSGINTGTFRDSWNFAKPENHHEMGQAHCAS
jgi:hypothetical protein